MNFILQNGKIKVENQTKPQVWEDSSLCPETSTKNTFPEFHLWIRMRIRIQSAKLMLIRRYSD
jgi:hypothetical protein